MRQQRFDQRKNDFCFAFLMAAVFAITVIGAVAGTLDVARGRAGADVAKTRVAPIAQSDIAEQAAQIAGVGVRR